MGRKTHPTALRLGYNQSWSANWYGDKTQFCSFMQQDIAIRNVLKVYLKEIAKDFVVSRVSIERNSRAIIVGVHTSRMNHLIGKGGEVVQEMEKRMQVAIDKMEHADGRSVKINILEVRVPEMDALLVAKSIAQQIGLRKSPKRIMVRAMEDAIRVGAGGVKIQIKGRINGVEIARKIGVSKGRIPTQTLRASIDFAKVAAETKYGLIGIKVWVFQKEIYGKRSVE